MPKIGPPPQTPPRANPRRGSATPTSPLGSPFGSPSREPHAEATARQALSATFYQGYDLDHADWVRAAESYAHGARPQTLLDAADGLRALHARMHTDGEVRAYLDRSGCGGIRRPGDAAREPDLRAWLKDLAQVLRAAAVRPHAARRLAF